MKTSKSMTIFKGLAFILILFGIASADTENLLIPIAITGSGFILLKITGGIK